VRSGAPQTRWVLIVITGPIASGKSTLATAVAQRLQSLGTRAAVIDLDVVHESVRAGSELTGDAAWDLARRRAASDATRLLPDAVVVIAEGSFNRPADRATFARNLGPSDEPIHYVTLQVSFDEALRRAQRDPTRGRSRDPDFLMEHFRRHSSGGPAPAADLLIDTEQTPLAAAVDAVMGLVATAG
jgi:adenylylsulfate kinase-like enzyme